ncbi:IS66 family transposase, partial [Rhodovibrio sodomensis]|uniref:IS66 family transposase n=1 Tax=Rhodovibrio sodomensis TaxID=1088 RepID=UPI0019045BFB
MIYLHTIHAISYQRLSALMLDMFGVSISEGTIANILSRAKEQVDAAVADITAELRKAGVIGCDETGARVAGQKYWQWVFGCATAVLHKVAPSRGKAVVREVLGEHVPAVWVSDRFAAQTGHGESRQLCLAHLLRDAQYAIDAGDTVFAPPLKDLLLRAIDIARRREELQDNTLYQYRCRLDRDLDDLVTRPADSRAGEKLRRQIRRVRSELFLCVTNPGCAGDQQRQRALPPPGRNFQELCGAHDYAESAGKKGPQRGLETGFTLHNPKACCPSVGLLPPFHTALHSAGRGREALERSSDVEHR